MSIKMDRSKLLSALGVVVAGRFYPYPEVIEVTQQLSGGNSGLNDNGVLTAGDTVFFGTVAGGYVYLIKVTPQGATSLQLFANAYDPTFGSDDSHGSPALEWIVEGHKLLAVGGAHGQYNPMKWAVVDVTTMTIVASGSFDTTLQLTYPQLVKTADGKISMFIRHYTTATAEDRLYKFEFDPSTNTWGTGTQISASGYRMKFVAIMGWNHDNGRFLLGIPNVDNAYQPAAVIQYDLSTKNFYDLAGNQLTPPFSPSGLPPSIRRNGLILKNYLYCVDWDAANNQLVLKKIALDNTLVASKVLASAAGGMNTAYASESDAGTITYVDGRLIVAFRNNSNRLEIAQVDPADLALKTLYVSPSAVIPLLITEDDRQRQLTFYFINLIDTTGARSHGAELSDNHVVYIVRLK